MFKPMKCASLMLPDGSIQWDKITYPKFLSAKFDGNRCYIQDGIAKSSSGKPIRNDHIRETLSNPKLNGLDGEIICGSPQAKDVRRRTSSLVAQKEGNPVFNFFVFDNYLCNKEFKERNETLFDYYAYNKILKVSQTLVHNMDELLYNEAIYVANGYEGIVLKDPLSPYKYGRSTLKENYMIKLKRFVDDEAIIIGFNEQMQNQNKQTLDEFGQSKRSFHQENMLSANTLGSLTVKDIKTNVVFNIGTGFDDKIRQEIWDNQTQHKGKIITYKHFPVGMKDKPNLPVFVAFRDVDDCGL